MQQPILIAGGGIGGLAAALSMARAGSDVALYERAAAFGETGAGIQLGPNATRVLHSWGQREALAKIASFPAQLQVRDALSGYELGCLALGNQAVQKYGAPYATVQRSDLHSLLLRAVMAQGNVALNLGHGVDSYADSGQEVLLRVASAPPVANGEQPSPHPHQSQPREVRGRALVGADGLWSRVRVQMVGNRQAKATGNLALRALVPQASLPERVRSQNVTLWLGPHLHVVQYPVCGGEYLNVVAVVQGRINGNPKHWDHANNGEHLALLTRSACRDLRNLVAGVADCAPEGVQPWRMWPVYDRPPMQSPRQQAKGCIALLGDAAHPMRPFLAQGAGMAIEDAAELGRLLAESMGPDLNMPDLLQHYALNRWRRNAKVQARARFNGHIFHANGVLRWARDTAMQAMGERLLDLPWLYGYQGHVATAGRTPPRPAAPPPAATSTDNNRNSLWNS